MTVSSTSNRKEFAGNDVTTAFATSPVIFFDDSDLEVYTVVTTTGVATLKTLTTHYTVSGGDGSTGTVTMLTAPTSAETLVIVRTLPLTQETDLVQNDLSDAEVQEDAFDKLTMIDQQLSARIERSLVLADSDISGASTELPIPAANALLGWNDTASALQNYTASDLGTDILVSAFMETVLDDADGDAAFQTLVDSATAETAPAIGDLIMLSDVSLAPDDGRKMTLANMLKVIDGLTAETAPAIDDELALYDITGAATDKITLENLLKVINGLTEDTAPQAGVDYALTYDGSASGVKKVLLGRTASPTSEASVPTTSGVSVALTTTIPSWATQVSLLFAGVSSSGTSEYLVQLGDSGGIETSGYVSEGCAITSAATAVSSSTAGFIIRHTSASAAVDGKLILDRVGSTNQWIATGNFRFLTTTVGTTAGSKTTSAAMDRITLTTVGGSETFDAGAIVVSYR